MKRRAMGLFLVTFAVWPMVQFALVQAQDVNPWKLMGFAMYSVPGPMKTVRIYEVSNEGSQRMLDFAGYDEDEQRAVDHFREWRRALGTLHPSDALARSMLELHPEFDGVVVAVISLRLDRETARLRAEITSDTHWRDGRDEPFAFPVPPAGATRERAP